MLYLSRVLPCYVLALCLPLVSKDAIYEVREQDRQRECPYQCDGIEEICVGAAGDQPEMVKCRSK